MTLNILCAFHESKPGMLSIDGSAEVGRNPHVEGASGLIREGRVGENYIKLY